ncbi:MAG: T9SS type A sorting domain-containing protein [Bacteroidia bacterium]
MRCFVFAAGALVWAQVGGNVPTAQIDYSQSLIPAYIGIPAASSGPGASTRIPYVAWITLKGLTPNKAYRFVARMDTSPTNTTFNITIGAGNNLYYDTTTHAFLRVVNPTLSMGGFTVSNGAGQAHVYFILEPTTNWRFSPSYTLYPKLFLVDTLTPTQDSILLIASQAPVKPLRVMLPGPNPDTTCSFVYDSVLASMGDTFGRGMVFLYDIYGGDSAMARRPISGGIVEYNGSLGFLNTVTSYLAAFKNLVAGKNLVWGAITPNNFPNGIRTVLYLPAPDSPYWLPPDQAACEYAIYDRDAVWPSAYDTRNPNHGGTPPGKIGTYVQPLRSWPMSYNLTVSAPNPITGSLSLNTAFNSDVYGLMASMSPNTCPSPSLVSYQTNGTLPQIPVSLIDVNTFTTLQCPYPETPFSIADPELDTLNFLPILTWWPNPYASLPVCYEIFPFVNEAGRLMRNFTYPPTGAIPLTYSGTLNPLRTPYTLRILTPNPNTLPTNTAFTTEVTALDWQLSTTPVPSSADIALKVKLYDASWNLLSSSTTATYTPSTNPQLNFSGLANPGTYYLVAQQDGNASYQSQPLTGLTWDSDTLALIVTTSSMLGQVNYVLTIRTQLEGWDIAFPTSLQGRNYHLYDLRGALVTQGTLPPSESFFLPAPMSGIYLLRLETPTGAITHRLAK